jgi:hypothetical protein
MFEVIKTEKKKKGSQAFPLPDMGSDGAATGQVDVSQPRR